MIAMITRVMREESLERGEDRGGLVCVKDLFPCMCCVNVCTCQKEND